MEYQRGAKSSQKEQSKTSSSLEQTSLNRVKTHPLLELQRTIGNQAVLKLLRSQQTPTDPTIQALGEARFGHDLSQLPLHSTQPAVPPTTLTVNQPGDVYEQEADQIAEQVMRITEPESPVSDDERKATNALMRTEQGANTTTGSADLPLMVSDVLNSSGGQPLDAKTRQFMERRFGHDLSQVRVHTDERAADAARGVAAQAFTVGEHIVFGDRQYAPDGAAGRSLLAHELAHTIQQRLKPATTGIFRKPIPGWNFTPADFARMREAGRALTISPDSGFFPAKLQENLLKTLAYVLGPKILPPATEGVNAIDFFHGHLVVKKDPATAKQAKAAEAQGEKFRAELSAERARALGGEVSFPKGYPLTPSNLGAYQKAVEKVLPAFGTLLDEPSKLPGAAVMYHTFEFNQPGDLKAKGEKLRAEDPRRHYVTPLDTNQPTQYTPPSGGYEKEYTHITSFSFLVDDKAVVHVRPFSPSTGFTTLELSTITGTTFPEPLENEK